MFDRYTQALYAARRHDMPAVLPPPPPPPPPPGHEGWTDGGDGGGGGGEGGGGGKGLFLSRYRYPSPLAHDGSAQF